MIRVVQEYNEGGNLLYAADFPGAFSRGKTREEALEKLPADVEAYCRWSGTPLPGELACAVVQEAWTAASVCDADSEVLFDGEALPLSKEEYQRLRRLVLKSAEDFQAVYDAVPQKDRAASPPRSTFYGSVPRTAREMYEHVNDVTGYYIRQLGALPLEDSRITAARALAVERLEALPDFLESRPVTGEFGEVWSLRKVLRRFVWHDRIHVKAMVRMAHALWGELENPFFFG